MQNNPVLERFKKFKAMIISADIPNNLLLEMAEGYITSDEPTPAEAVPVLDGQMSLSDYMEVSYA
jgi:hypothetical protein